jgi:putative ABC transport system ATP-binding protein
MATLDSNLFRFIWRHSRRDQIVILCVIFASLPFYWISLDIPKRIVNDALLGRAFKDGQMTATLFDWSLELPDWLGGGLSLGGGFQFEQMDYLFVLSGLFLLLVVINGAFKYVINISKGVLGERMLRRMRFILFATLLKFKPEEVRAVKPAEISSMIKDEVEPIGEFVGDAFILPVFLGTQALTALLFIMAQNVWLGLVALGIILVQAFVIPYLRREQLRLTSLRQIASRKFAGRIGEIVEGAPAVHIHGTAAYNEAEIGGRLGDLFRIRVDLFKRKFAVKYLNNFLAQITPFFFYSIGGYFALKGSLDIGQLVAVIAAYRDLPPPIKELIDWDQARADVTIKYQQVVSQFSAERLTQAAHGNGASDTVPSPQAPISIDSLRVVDRRGNALLENMTTTIECPAHVALVGASGSGRDILAKVLGRQITEYRGAVRFGGIELNSLADGAASRLIAYAGAEPPLFSGTIRDNVLYSLRRHAPALSEDGADSPAERWRRVEALRSGNPIASVDGDWIDYALAGVSGPDQLDDVLLDVLRTTGMYEEVYQFGLLGKLPADCDPDLIDCFIAGRRAIRTALSQKELRKLVEPFDPGAYNTNATIGENLLFGVLVGNQLTAAQMAANSYLRSILDAEALVEPLTEIGLKIAETTLDTFKGLPPGHPLFERYSLIRTEELQDFQRLVETPQSRGALRSIASEDRSKLISLALDYVEPRHRLGLIDPAFRSRVLRARATFRGHLPGEYAERIEFYDPDRIMMAAPIRDNLLFGRIAFGVAGAEKQVRHVALAALADLGLDKIIHRLGLDYEVGPGGKLLFAPQRAAINLARCLIKRPEVLIVDGALAVFGPSEAKVIMDRIRSKMAGRTVMVTLADSKDAADFDQVLAFDGVRLSFEPDSDQAARSSRRLVTPSASDTVH